MFAEEKTRGGFISSLFKIRNCRLSGGFADAEIDGNKLRPFKLDHPDHVFTLGHGVPRGMGGMCKIYVTLKQRTVKYHQQFILYNLFVEKE